MNNILITGEPGCGKTTLIVKLAMELEDLHPAGFYTEEIRAAGIRQGFELVSFTGGRRALLAFAGLGSRYRVGKYGVDIEDFESFLSRLPLKGKGHGLIIIDEIGKMECHSALFRDLTLDLLDGPAPVIATIALRGNPFIESLKTRNDISLALLTRENRDEALPMILERVREITR